MMKEWGHIPMAMDFVQHLIQFDPDERHSAAQALEHSWIVDSPQSDIELSNLRRFKKHNQLKSEIMRYLINTTQSVKLTKIRKTFEAMDTDNTGFIKVE